MIPKAAPERGEGAHDRARLWDLPTRLVHWSIAVLFAVSWWTGETDRMAWHKLSGSVILGLVLFRVYWGFAGGTSARFRSFVRGPRAVCRYAAGLFRRGAAAWPGHNPMGGWSVLALLALLLAQCGLGLFATDVDGIESGPLDDLVSFETGRRVAHLHGFVFEILLVLVGLHVLAVLFYLLYKRENLIAAMIHGYKKVSAEDAARLRFAGFVRAIVGVALAALIVVAVTTRFRFAGL